MAFKDKEKQKEYQRNWKRKRREDFFKDKICECGSVSNLELDHIDRTKKISHNIWSWSLIRRNEELKKCQILCKDCHLKKTIPSHFYYLMKGSKIRSMDTTKENKYFIKFYCDNCGAQLKKVPISKLFQGVVCKMCKTKNYG